MIPTEMGLLSNVRHFNLEGNVFSGTIPTEMGLPSQLHVDLEGNALSGTIPTEMGLLSQMLHLYLNNNALSGTIPESICNLIITGGLADCALQVNPFACPLPWCGVSECQATCQ